MRKLFAVLLLSLLASSEVQADPYSDAQARVAEDLATIQEYCGYDPGCVCYLVDEAYNTSHNVYAQLSTQIDPFWAQMACAFYGCFGWDGAYQLFFAYSVAMGWNFVYGNMCV